MKKKLSPILALLLALVAAFFGYTGITEDAAPAEPGISIQETLDDPAILETEEDTEAPTDAETEDLLDPDGAYTTKEDVALYIHTYGELPGNFMTKNEAKIGRASCRERVCLRV